MILGPFASNLNIYCMRSNKSLCFVKQKKKKNPLKSTIKFLQILCEKALVRTQPSFQRPELMRLRKLKHHSLKFQDSHKQQTV